MKYEMLTVPLFVWVSMSDHTVQTHDASLQERHDAC